MVDALKDLHQLPELLAQLRLARSSYFYHRTRLRMIDKYLTIRQNITEILEANRRRYGYRRLQASLAEQSVAISEQVVQRLMKQENLIAACHFTIDSSLKGYALKEVASKCFPSTGNSYMIIPRLINPEKFQPNIPNGELVIFINAWSSTNSGLLHPRADSHIFHIDIVQDYW